MDVALLDPPSRFPTVVHDPGDWWGEVAAEPGVRLRRLSINVAWWRQVCAPAACRLVAGDRDLRAAARRAEAALHRLQREPVQAVLPFVDDMRAIVDHLQRFDAAQSELWVDIDAGPVLRGVSYTNSAELVDLSGQDTLLSRLIAGSLDGAVVPDVLLVAVTSPADLLASLVAVQILRGVHPGIYACLIDHGCENYTLAPHLPKLRGAETLDRVFDSIIEEKDDRDFLVPWLVTEIRQGRRPRGYLRAAEEARSQRISFSPYRPPPPTEVFASAPVLRTRISTGRCYWARCTFYVHNAKYRGGPPSTADVSIAVKRLSAMRRVGYRHFIFTDEALSPSMLRHLASALLDANIDIRWTCRSKPEMAFDEPLFELVGAAGCYEILFGIESTSPRVLRLMDKEAVGLDKAGMETILRAAQSAGIGLHLTAIAGFPGERLDETMDTVEFIARMLANRPNQSYSLNPFILFPGTPVFDDPARFGIRALSDGGDMEPIVNYRPLQAWARHAREIQTRLPAIAEALAEDLGWRRLGADAGTRAAVGLYFQSGLGAIMRSSSTDPFAAVVAQSSA